MDGVSTALLFILLLGVAAVLVYVLIDYSSHKTTMDKRVSETEVSGKANAASITDEKAARLSNVKYVVGQVNEVNEDIYNTWSSNIGSLRSNTAALGSNVARSDASMTAMMRGIDTFFKFGTTGSATPSSLYSVDATVLNPDLQLIKHVTALGGLNANNLTNATVNERVKLCGVAAAGAAAPCIELPNAAGDTYFTSLVPNRGIIMGAPVDFKSAITLSAPTTATLTPTSGNISLDGAVGIGSSAAPAATLHVFPQATKAPLSAGALRVDANNNVVIAANGSAGAASATLSINAANELVITSPPGGLRVVGDVKATGTITPTSA